MPTVCRPLALDTLPGGQIGGLCHYHYARSGNRLEQVSELFRTEDLHARPAESTGDGRAEAGPEILRGIDLSVRAGEIHALMGPNGSGKSTLANALLANPEYEVTRGRIFFQGDDITDWPTEVRAKAGMFLAFQYPQEIPGVSVIQFLRQSLSARKGIDLSVLELRLSIMEWMKRLGMDSSFADRYLNEGFSGGEKKRNEILQMAILEPELAILDETDSGLDIDALRTVASGIREVRKDRPELGIILITHYQRLLDELAPDHVHILVDGRIVASGGLELAEELERDGYEAFRGKDLGAPERTSS
jgi:Fe-S cluster assembly ATP-binding protein